MNDPKRPSSKFLVYALVDPRTGETRYVGKSTTGLKRPRQHRRPNVKQQYLYNWVELLRRERLTFEIVVLAQLPSVEGLGEAEQFWIKTLRGQGCRLTNLTLGGNGRLGLKHTEKTKKRISLKNSGTGNGMYGRHQSPEAKARLAEASSERIWTDKSRQKISLSKRGIATRGRGWTHSQATCQQLSEQMIGNTRNLGKHLSQEAKDKISRSRPVGKSGYRGVIWNKQRGRWQARFKGKHLGFYDTALKARAVLPEDTEEEAL